MSKLTEGRQIQNRNTKRTENVKYRVSIFVEIQRECGCFVKMSCCAFLFDSLLSVLKSHCVCIRNLYASAALRKHIVIPMPSIEDSVHYLGLSPAAGPCSHLTKRATLACHWSIGTQHSSSVAYASVCIFLTVRASVWFASVSVCSELHIFQL